jgi:hypothetical protein
LKTNGKTVVRRVPFHSRIDEVTFETCPLLATRGKGVMSGLVNGVLAGTRCLRDLQPLLALIGELQQRDFFGSLR